MKILVTGGAGFIGSAFVRHMITKGHDVTVLDKLTYAGRMENLQDVMGKIEFVKGDICDSRDIEKATKDCEAVFNFAAESHVDRSIGDASVFVNTNVLGTYVLLEAARKRDMRFVQISTDEVYGQILDGSFKETDTLNPRNPYSATKAGAELLCRSFHTTHGLKAIVTRSSNNYGPRQFPEKFIPVLVLNAFYGKPLPVYGEGKQVRDWIHVEDNCEGIETAFRKGKSGEVYNVGGGNEMPNIELARLVLKVMGKPENLITFVPDRLGHDFRYALDCTKMEGLGWKPVIGFEEGIKKTIGWYLSNEQWWKKLMQNIG